MKNEKLLFLMGIALVMIQLSQLDSWGADELPDIPNRQEFWLGRWYENGVENRLQADYFGNWNLNSTLSIEVGMSLSLLQQWGPDLLGLAGHASFPGAKSELTLAVQHERWPDWRVTENRVEFYWSVFPHRDLNFSFGFTYRAPLFGKSLSVPFLNWGSNGGGEISSLYRIDWIFLNISPFQLSFLLWNYDHMRLYTPDNFHFTIKTAWEMNPSLQIFLAATAGLQGFSGAIVSWPQTVFSVGLAYEL